MAVRLTLCAFCTQSRPEISRTIERLQCHYADDVNVVALRCMAACDDVPAVMIDYDYFPRITPQELWQRIADYVEAAKVVASARDEG
jgi:NADH:ubiquinone oxidoreductase subunit E